MSRSRKQLQATEKWLKKRSIWRLDNQHENSRPEREATPMTMGKLTGYALDRKVGTNKMNFLPHK